MAVPKNAVRIGRGNVEGGDGEEGDYGGEKGRREGIVEVGIH